MTFLQNNDPDDCTIIYDTSDIANCDDFYLPKLISIYNNYNNSNESYNDYVSINRNMLPYTVSYMIIIYYLIRRLHDHLHSQNIKKMLMSVHMIQL